MTAQPIPFILMMELQAAPFTVLMEAAQKVTDGTALATRQQQLLHKILRRKQQHLRLERRRHISHRTQLDRNRKQHPRHERQQPRPRQRRRRKMGNSRRRRGRLKQQLRTNNTKHHIQLRLRSSNRQRSIIALRSNFRKYLNKLQHRRRQRQDQYT